MAIQTVPWVFVPSESPLKFRGGPVLTLDVKGRLTVPARWQKLLEEHAENRLIVTRDPAYCLGLYPPDVFAQLEDALLKLPAEDEDWRRLYLGAAHELEIDSSSRVLIPPELRRFAGMSEGGSVSFMGVGRHFELWAQDSLDKQLNLTVARGKPQALKDLVFQ